MKDRQLVERAGKGEEQALSDIFNLYIGKVFSILLAYTDGDRATAEDLSQGVFVKVFNNLDGVNSPENLKPWIGRVAHNTGIDHLRKKRAEREATNGLMHLYRPRTDTPEEEFIGKQLAALIERTIADEPDDSLKQTAILFYKKDKSIKEIAEIQGLSETATTSRLARFRQRLKKRLVLFALEKER